MTKWDVRAVGLTLGCVWSSSVFLLSIVAMTWHRGARIVDIFSTVYIGYRVGLLGSFVGAFWAFIDGAVTGILIAWIYNKFVA